MNPDEFSPSISLAGHPREAAIRANELRQACNLFFVHRGIPVVNWRGEIAAEVRTQSARRRQQINDASRRFRARKKAAAQ